MTALRDRRDHQAAERFNSGSDWTETGLVFTTLRGAPIQPANVNKLFGALCDQAGVRRIRFHDLRHSCATLLYELGVPIENIQDILGHSSPVITKVLYVGGRRRCKGLRPTVWVICLLNDPSRWGQVGVNEPPRIACGGSSWRGIHYEVPSQR